MENTNPTHSANSRNVKQRFEEAFNRLTTRRRLRVKWHNVIDMLKVFIKPEWPAQHRALSCASSNVLYVLRLWGIRNACKDVCIYSQKQVSNSQSQSQVLWTQAVRPLCPANVRAIMIITEGKQDLKQLAQGCTYTPGNIPSQGQWLKWF